MISNDIENETTPNIDKVKTVKYFKTAADKNSPHSMFLYRKMLFDGERILVNIRKAIVNTAGKGDVNVLRMLWNSIW